MSQMNRNWARASVGALAVTLCVGAAQVATAQMGGGGGPQHDGMHWGNTSQYGVPQILLVLIGVAVLVLLVMLIVRTSKK